ncbi:MAG: hypothetical protein OER90_08230 [Gemmatimonadota bacterium]|nr:hypothetical protein [Gemmatimonadota bacterium]
MGPIDPDLFVIFPSIIVITALILRFRLKNKELETRGSNAELGPVVDALRERGLESACDAPAVGEVGECTSSRLREAT